MFNNIKHVSEGCLKVNYLIPVHYSFNAYKMALHNRYKFYTIDLMHIGVGNYPLIYDPLYCDLEHFVKKQPLQIHHGMYKCTCSFCVNAYSLYIHIYF